MTCRDRILQILADGRFHSGNELGADLRISRTAVWKHIKLLQQGGIDIYSIPGRGYQMATPVELLSSDRIRSELDERTTALLQELEIHAELDSTNRHLMHRAAQGAPSGLACLAEKQTAGRGRRGRVWHSPYGQNLYMSLLWRFAATPSNLGSLSLAIAVSIVSALSDIGVRGVGVKWPNDLFWQGRKMAGVLLEMAGESGGPCSVVIGIGLNTHMAGNDAIDQPWVDVTTAAGKPVSRNELAGRALHHVLSAVNEYSRSGSARLLDEWRRLDIYQGSIVTLHLHDDVVTGRIMGIDPSGALLLEKDGAVSSYHSGEISLRPVV